jgi:hypothetical protein
LCEFLPGGCFSRACLAFKLLGADAAADGARFKARFFQQD